ncbi:/ atpC / Na(+)-translocating ATPase subunit epsilon /:134191 Forward [Candidatus Hepatoplasma crinochetorum]|uniref:ATP synthase epsilon chain n=1 Tax=Candidatus Hepatoplasma crinochetorum TaxID=295596 RepID=A0A0G7ZM60_9MOLU|nr:/ atpC / Na(+)-translocating ATPase subunit epsilon /:134191 Forward [Candidatus Hepatoplasma crinochetorum]
MANTFKLSILTPRENFFVGEVQLLDIEAFDGYIGILKDHIPFVSSIKTNYFWILDEKGDKKKGVILDGILSVLQSEVTVITSRVNWLIDKELKVINAKIKEKTDLLKNDKLTDFERKELEKKLLFYQKRLEGTEN